MIICVKKEHFNIFSNLFSHIEKFKVYLTLS